MTEQNGQRMPVDAMLEELSRIPLPADVETRLQSRLARFYRETQLSSPAPRARKRRWISAYIGVGLATCLLVAAALLSFGSRDAWAQVARSMRSRPWMLITLRIPEGTPLPPDFRPPQTWFSAKYRIGARGNPGFAQFIDFASETTYQYDERRKTIELTPTGYLDRSDDFVHLDTILALVAGGDPRLKLSESSIEIGERTREEVNDNGRPWIEFTFACVNRKRSPADYHFTVRVDPETRLAVQFRSTEKYWLRDPEESRTYSIEYPAEGPRDIYAVGAPKSAEVVDRRHPKSHNHARIKELWDAYVKARQKPLEPCAVAILETGPESPINSVAQAYRKSRDGAVERAEFQPLSDLNRTVWRKTVKVPDDLRVRWWKEQVAKLPYAPVHRGNELLPDQIGYPDHFMGQSPLNNPDIECSLDEHPDRGPEGTVLLRFRIKTSHGSNDIRYWIAPERDYMALRSEVHYSLDPAPWNNTTVIIDKVEKSPGGRWYATEARQGRVEKSGDALSSDGVYYMKPDAKGNERLRIGKSAKEHPSDRILVVKPNPDGSKNMATPVSTSVYRYFVDFEEPTAQPSPP